MIPLLTEGLHQNSCNVLGPMDIDAARAAIIERAHGVVACNDDVPIPGLRDAIAAAGATLVSPTDPTWNEQLLNIDVGITGARLAVAWPPAIALTAAPGSPRATSLVPPLHVCVVRVDDVVHDLATAMEQVTKDELPSALTWIGGPSRTGDLEMILTLGVHGPKAVDVVLLAED